MLWWPPSAPGWRSRQRSPGMHDVIGGELCDIIVRFVRPQCGQTLSRKWFWQQSVYPIIFPLVLPSGFTPQAPIDCQWTHHRQLRQPIRYWHPWPIKLILILTVKTLLIDVVEILLFVALLRTEQWGVWLQSTSLKVWTCTTTESVTSTLRPSHYLSHIRLSSSSHWILTDDLGIAWQVVEFSDKLRQSSAGSGRFCSPSNTFTSLGFLWHTWLHSIL